MWFQIALALGGRTVAEWQATMTLREFHRWGDFYRINPFDAFHLHHRPAALIAAAAGGGKFSDLAEFLQPDRGAEELSDADMSTMRTFGFTRKGE